MSPDGVISTFAAVTTGKGTGAISTIEVFGKESRAILKKIFKPAGTKPAKFETGKILLGTITDGTEIVDQVTIGCEQPNSFAINCHGNPLIAADVMQLLGQHGAKLVGAEQLLTKILYAQKPINTIRVEAKLIQPKAKTIQGAKIIANQIDAGLGKLLQKWLKNTNEISLGKIEAEAIQILQKSQTAKLIIYGCTSVLVGPPNSGKSTLLNYLAGRQKAIVTDIKGTTRDWVSAQCQIAPLSLKLIDTAGLDEPRPSEGLGEKLAATPKNNIEKAAQQKSLQILEEADLVLLVLDNSQPAEELDDRFSEKIADKKVLAVLNKSDLPAKFDIATLPENLSSTVQISAKTGTGVENLLEEIRQVCGVADFDLKTTVCFTPRQENLLTQLKNAKSKQQAVSIITELLNGRLRV
ncbi:MAG: GTPase [Planctomycetota bacterium]|jgi:tRNA modification GTPase